MYRCLIVEDDPQVAKLNATYLAQEGFLVSAVAADASQALAAMEEQTFDLVLLDVFLPGMNGLELLRRLRATQQTSEVIIISAARDSAQICEALRLGCVDYIIILGGGGLHSDLILRLCHDLVAEIGVLHLGDIAIVAEDALRIGHHGLQLILKAESFFNVHCIHSSSLFVDPMISVLAAVVIELLV